MLRGMTGFAQAKGRFKDNEVNMEMRSLNHRFFECAVHLPEGLGALEDLIKNIVYSQISRGRVTVVVSLSSLHPKVSVNYSLADSYVRAIKHLNQKLKLTNNLSISQLISIPGVLNVAKIHVTPEMTNFVKKLTFRAVHELIRVRDKEGAVIYSDVSRRIEAIRKEVGKINVATRVYTRAKKSKLSEDELSAFLKSTDIAEEITRITYHVRNLRTTLKKAVSSAKELDFIAQEIQREANTISAKAQNAKASASVIRVKSAVDKIREQLQNAE